jgi:hypothetical protein
VSEPGRPTVGARQVVLLAAAAVAVVLGLQLISWFVQPLDDALGYVPLVIVALVVVTVFILYRVLRPGARRD